MFDNQNTLTFRTLPINDSIFDLVSQAREQDSRAFAQLYEGIYKDLYRFAYYTLGNVQDAEDVVSETVIAGFEGVSKLRNVEAFRPWMFKILSNQCKRQLKKYISRPQPLDETQSCEFPNIDQNYDLKKAFEQLDKMDRMIVSLSVFGGYNSKETAAILHMNSNTVRSRLKRALEKMRGKCI